MLVTEECQQLNTDQYLVTFSRQQQQQQHRAGDTALCDIGITIGETLVVSAENKPLIAIATGTLTATTMTTVTMVTDRCFDAVTLLCLIFSGLSPTLCTINLISYFFI